MQLNYTNLLSKTNNVNGSGKNSIVEEVASWLTTYGYTSVSQAMGMNSFTDLIVGTEILVID